VAYDKTQFLKLLSNDKKTQNAMVAGFLAGKYPTPSFRVLYLLCTNLYQLIYTDTVLYCLTFILALDAGQVIL
jgi:hypothetical protein